MPCALNCYCPYRPLFTTNKKRDAKVFGLLYAIIASQKFRFGSNSSYEIIVSTSAAVCKNGLRCKTVLNADISRDHYSFNSFVRGHHVYKEEWILTVSESLNCVREPLNEKDKNAGAVIRDD